MAKIRSCNDPNPPNPHGTPTPAPTVCLIGDGCSLSLETRSGFAPLPWDSSLAKEGTWASPSAQSSLRTRRLKERGGGLAVDRVLSSPVTPPSIIFGSEFPREFMISHIKQKESKEV